MSNEKMREEFETEFRKHPKFEGNALYVDAMLERGSDGNYRFTIAEGAWWGWQASRAAVVIDLDKPWQTNVGAMMTPNGVKFAIESVGLKYTVKP